MSRDRIRAAYRQQQEDAEEPAPVAVELTAEPGKASLTVGGVDISDQVSAITVTIAATNPAPVMEIHLDAPILAASTSRARVALDPATTAALLTLGWTPPPEEAPQPLLQVTPPPA